MPEPKVKARSCAHYTYTVYGISLHSEIPLPLPTTGVGELAHIELHTAAASFFTQLVGDTSLQQSDDSWYQLGILDDGAFYARWTGVGEFLVSLDGHKIICHQFDIATSESFHVYLLGQALSFALVRSGLEPTHATTVVINGEAVVFLGDSGVGKSTLAASFVNAGHSLLTDDLLVFKTVENRVIGFPGPARIKLFPKIAKRFLSNASDGVCMNPDTRKLILPLDDSDKHLIPVPVRVIYSLLPADNDIDDKTVHVEALSSREGFVELVKNTYNTRIVNSHRLSQQLEQTSNVAARVPVRRLLIPRGLDQLLSFQNMIITDMKNHTKTTV